MFLQLSKSELLKFKLMFFFKAADSIVRVCFVVQIQRRNKIIVAGFRYIVGIGMIQVRVRFLRFQPYYVSFGSFEFAQIEKKKKKNIFYFSFKGPQCLQFF